MEIAVTTAQLVGAAVGIIGKIKRVVETARQNKVEYDHLKDRLPTIGYVLHGLPPDPELERPLAELLNMLQQAYNLVVACQKRSTANQLFWASIHADRLRAVNARIDSHLSLFPLISYAAIARRLNEPGCSYPGSPAPQKVEQEDVFVAEREILEIFPLNHTGEEPGCSSAGSQPNVEDAFVAQCKILGIFPPNHTGEVPGCSSAASLQDVDLEDAFMAEHKILQMFPPSHTGEMPGCSSPGSLQDVDDTFVAERKILVYEHGHMSNTTLRDHLVHGVSSSSPVTVSWRTRMEVLLGVSRAIEHLHRCATLHGNVSSSNIHLDANCYLTPRLSGFLGAQVLQADQLVAEVVGTPGYIDPEYRRTGRMSPASDVYSFGVVILEALTGRPPVSGSWEEGEDGVTLVESMLPVIREGNLRDLLDGRPALQLQPMLRQLEALELVTHTARLCLWPHGRDRPAMSNVVASLEKALGIIRSHAPMKLL